MIKTIKIAFFLFIPHISLSNIAIMFIFKSQVHLLVMNPFFVWLSIYVIYVSEFAHLQTILKFSGLYLGAVPWRENSPRNLFQ
ncbi:hypothetical protein DI44_18480 [Geobacillus sp. CAMR5420]|nr:hypothetical protein DI44_18480 [Geobacillus sp. CAMR5420]KMY56536.1 hypothetical protein AA906_16020 [Geobacillus stearothermophilus]OQP21006.1 hypothetical protein B1694_12580 [Geobacillus zalihae]